MSDTIQLVSHAFCKDAIGWRKMNNYWGGATICNGSEIDLE